ncbi:MAG: S8 family serine peptidase [Micropruina sp.]
MFTKTLRLALSLALAASALLLTPGAAPAAPQGDRVRVIVELRSRSDADGVVRGLGNSASKVRHTKVLPYVMLEVPTAAINGLRRNPNVKAVSVDRAEPPTLDSALPVINGDDVHTLGFTGAASTVAILDTGIDADHPFFGAGGSRIVAQHCFSDPNDDDGNAAEESLCPDGTTEDTSANVDDDVNATCLNGANNICDHGTHVAGIAAGSLVSDSTNAPGDGVAPGANIIAVQVFTRFNNGVDCSPNAAPCVLTYQGDQILALDWVRGQAVGNPGWNVVASNMSLGGGNMTSACDADPRKTAVDSNLGVGIATVISAGNNSFLNAVGAPGCISTAFTVGSTDDDDTVSGFSNRGVLVDVMAPGNDIDSSEPDDTYGNKSGTSMAAPMVTGALAVLRSASPGRAIGTLLTDITSTGVPITYSIGGGGTTTTPRLNLLAALQVPNTPPTLAADNDPVSVAEGSLAVNTGTVADSDGSIASISANIGSVSETAGVWNWSYTPPDGPASIPVTITATDDKGETGSVGFTLNVTNVAPVVTITSISDVDEGGTVNLEATFTDPGDDTHSASIDWGTTEGTAGAVNVVGNTVTASYTYGDNGTYDIEVTVTDSDGAEGSDTGDTAISNVDPTAEITGPATTTWNGQQIIFGTEGSPVDFEAEATDPGSDDLTFDWTYGDGATDSNTHLVNDPATDPAKSPSVQPRDVTDNAPHTYLIPCAATVGLSVTDDDGGSDSDSAQVIILGTSTDAGTLGVWQTDYRDKRSKLHTTAEKLCLLSTVRVLSTVFSEKVALSSIANGVSVLYPKNTKNARDQFDAHLLALWLNVADGSIALSDPVDTDGIGGPDTTVGALILAAEAVRTSASPSNATLTMYKNIFEAINAAN